MDDSTTLPPIPTVEPARSVQIGRLLADPWLLDDIVADNVKNHFISTELPIEKYDGLQLPTSYVKYLRNIVSVLNPIGISASGTGMMLAEALRDMVLGGHLKVQVKGKSENHQFEDRRLDDLTKNVINKAYLNAELFGTAAIVASDRKTDVLSAPEFWYDEWNNVFYSVTHTIRNGEDGYLHEKRYMQKKKGNYQVVSEIYFVVGDTSKSSIRTDDSAHYIKTTYEPFLIDKDKFNRPEALGISIMTHNNMNMDWVGTSMLEPILDQLRTFELTQHEYTKAMYFTKPRAVLMNDAVDIDENGEPIVDLTKDVFLTVDALAFEEQKNMIETFQFKFDAQAFHQKLSDDLQLMLSKVGLDSRVVTFTQGGTVEKSATEVTYEDSRVNSLVESRREEFRPQIIRAIEVLESVSGLDLDVTFIPLHYLNMSSMINNVQILDTMNLISRHQALSMIYPRWTQKQINDEIRRIDGSSDRERKVEGEDYIERKRKQEESGYEGFEVSEERRAERNGSSTDKSDDSESRDDSE